MTVDASALKRCRFCGRSPAIDATVRAHRGVIIVMQFRSLRGPFCHECGAVALRNLTIQTLWQGWWGVLSLIFGTPFTLVWNFFTWLRIRRLPPPAGATGEPASSTPPSATATG